MTCSYPERGSTGRSSVSYSELISRLEHGKELNNYYGKWAPLKLEAMVQLRTANLPWSGPQVSHLRRDSRQAASLSVFSPTPNFALALGGGPARLPPKTHR